MFMMGLFLRIVLGSKCNIFQNNDKIVFWHKKNGLSPFIMITCRTTENILSCEKRKCYKSWIVRLNRSLAENINCVQK